AHNILVHVRNPPRPEDIDAFCRLVPMPDLVVHVVAPLEVVLARTFARRDPALRGRTREETERFIRHGYVLWDQLMTHELLSRRTIRVTCDGDSPEACRVPARELVDFLFGPGANTSRVASRLWRAGRGWRSLLPLEEQPQPGQRCSWRYRPGP